uniref:NADH-ubiquinone oxidoreductase chain 6 n=1 Tax=Mola mola TaxID=94237 RepID=A0A3Q3WP13_MOLML
DCFTSLSAFPCVLGLVAVASNPSPYFAALGLVVVAGLGCGVLVGHGGSFLSLVLFLIYLGGMLVVFAYSAALAAEPYPENELGEFSVSRGDIGGVALIYSLGGGMLVIGAWVLLLTLFVVLELTRGLSRGALRAV